MKLGPGATCLAAKLWLIGRKNGIYIGTYVFNVEWRFDSVNFAHVLPHIMLYKIYQIECIFCQIQDNYPNLAKHCTDMRKWKLLISQTNIALKLQLHVLYEQQIQKVFYINLEYFRYCLQISRNISVNFWSDADGEQWKRKIMMCFFFVIQKTFFVYTFDAKKNVFFSSTFFYFVCWINDR